MAEVSDAPFARNETGLPNAGDIILSGGQILLHELDDSFDEDGDGWADLGEIPELAIEPSTEFKEHYTTRTGKRVLNKKIPIQQKFDVRFALEEVNERNAALFFAATPEAETNAATAGFAEYEMIPAAKLGRRYQVKDSSGNKARGINPAKLVLEAQGATQVLASAGRTLTFATAGDTITASTGSFIDDGFYVGRTLVVAGTVSNNGSYTIIAVTALVITVSQNLTNEGPLNATATLDSADVTLDSTDYSLESESGLVLIKATATHIAEGEPIDATLTADAGADTTRQIPVQTREAVTVALMFIGNDGDNGRKYALVIPKISIAANGAFGLVTDNDWTRMTFTGAAEKKDADTPVAYFVALPASAA